MNTPTILLIALLLDAIIGEPRWLWSRISHPAVIMGNIVGWLDRSYNTRPGKKARGIGVVALLVTGAAIIGIFFSSLPDSDIFSTIFLTILLAQKSLAQHVSAVARALRVSIDGGRDAVALIVGRDTGAMDQTAIARSAIESAAENLSDGVVAPVFWFLLLGLPGLLIYKIVNTADSMIGYLNNKYRDFGWAAARLDDLLNWIPARITAILLLAAGLALGKWKYVLRDAPLHRSPNAGWPEAAMAILLNVSLSGPRSYDGTTRDFPYVFPEGRDTVGPDDIDAAVIALWKVWAIAIVVFLVAALLV
jgi:adenosylcobinamide-phosphate synthase